MPADASLVREVFLAAAELPVSERVTYLTAHCGDDAELQAAVQRLLAAHEQPASVLVRPAPGIPTADYVPITEKPGTKIGPYKLMEQIGEGGFGLVFVAEQIEPVKRRVALKVIKPGMDSQAVIARFEAERQALAVMDHPNIARVLDAGATESGRPYFVMELVRGIPITNYCDQSQLTQNQRLLLFVDVCHAIQHAHQKGIIHRDIKPSNVLVASHDGKPVAKVIDFGVAKAISQSLTERTIYTQFAQMIGTPLYMSPEQAEMSGLDIDTRSDIYSLGVLLYELLTGSTPLEKKNLATAAYDEIRRLIREEEPPRPSHRLSTCDTLPSLAVNRKTEPAKLSRMLQGELDWVVMKALEKDRMRRYETASGLARDVQRYLADEIVEARPPSAGYRLRKFAQKHRPALTTAAAILLLLLAGATVSTWLAIRATAAERAARVESVRASAAEREANRERATAEAAEQQAQEARGEAVQQRDEALSTAYANGMGLAKRALDAENVIRARELLEEVPQEAAGRNLRGFEWDYLNRLCHSELLTLHHDEEVTCVAFSPDGRRVASGSTDKTVKVSDSETGKELFSFRGHAEWIRCLAFSPDGRLASAEEGKLKIWDGATGKELLTLTGQKWWMTCLAFSPDGRLLASGSHDRTVKVWDSATGKELHSFGGDTDYITCVAFSPDGRRLAAGTWEHTIEVWDLATGKERHTLEGNVNLFWDVGFSPDGQRVAAGSDDGMVYVWDSATGKELHSFRADARGIGGVAFSPDGHSLATGGNDGTVKLWNSATGKQRSDSFQGHARPVMDVAFSPDGQRLVSGSHDATVRIWDAARGSEPYIPAGHYDWTYHRAFVNPGNWPYRWESRPRAMALSPDGGRFAWQDDGTVKVWDGAVGRWDGAVGREVLSLDGHTKQVDGVAFSPDGKRLASGSHDKTVKVWSCETGKELLSIEDQGEWISCVAFSPDGQRLASGSHDPTVKIWDSATGKLLGTLAGHADGVSSVAFSPDGLRLASAGGDETVKIWDWATGKELLSLEGHTQGIYVVAFSPDGRFIASGSRDSTARLWDSATGKELFTLRGHVFAVYGVAFSPDSQRLATGGADSVVRLWDTATGKELIALKNDTGEVYDVLFTPDGERLAAVSENGYISLWETNVPPDVRDRRAARALVVNLFWRKGLRADVLDSVRAVPWTSATQRQHALAAAETIPEDPEILQDLAWKLLKLPGRAASDYRQALRFSEGACQLEPKNALYLTTLGMAHYRVGNDDKALEMLLRADQIEKPQPEGSSPATLAFLVMTRHRLGQTQEAQTVLERLRECMKAPDWAQEAEAEGFVREAEAVLEKPRTTGDK